MAVLLKRDVMFWHYGKILKNQDLVYHLHLPKLFDLISYGTFDAEFLSLISEQKKLESLLLKNSDINRIYVNPFRQNSYMVSDDFAELVSKHLNLKTLKNDEINSPFYNESFFFKADRHNYEYYILTEDLFTQIFHSMNKNDQEFLTFNKMIFFLFKEIPGASELFLIARY
jgi:hypothetical protein